jgi:Arc/MetJ-type ribon-helix-helix transcriptional regulator
MSLARAIALTYISRYMKTISVNISEPVYKDFIEHARKTDRTAAELIREAMELFRNQRIRPRTSVAALKPVDLGKTLRPLTSRDDLLGEMLK